MSCNMSCNGQHPTKQWEGLRLGHAPRGFRGHIEAILVEEGHSDLVEGELERRLIELGFIPASPSSAKAAR